MTPEDAHRILDEEILALEQRVLELRTRRNSYTHPCRLPPELLLEIFLFLVVPFRIEEWHEITHVCRYWRRVALEAPILWTAPPPRHQAYILLMLERSQTADVDIRINRKTYFATVVAIFKHSTRIKTLRLFQDTRVLGYTQEELPPAGPEFSRLESLSVENNLGRDEPFTLSTNQFRQLTSLRRLELLEIGIDWDIFPFPNLTHLNIHTWDEASIIPVQRFCRILAGMTALENLAINMVFDESIQDNQGMSTTPVQLPNLEAFELRNGHFSHIHSLLNCLSLPNLQRLEVGEEAGHELDNWNAGTSAPVILATLENGNFGTLDSLMISGLKLTFHSKHHDLERHPLQVSLPTSPTSEATATQFLSGLTSSTRNNTLCLTHVHLATPLRPHELIHILGALPQLETLKISDSQTIMALPSALNETLDYVLGPSILVPRLHSITCCSFHWENDGFSVLTDLYHGLSQRYRDGVGVKRLRLLDCFGFPESITSTLDAIGVLVYSSDNLLDSAWQGDGTMRTAELVGETPPSSEERDA
ncbi:hypothetical protein D9619_010118 [Psilocybe cf. subviscida]|uniref:F-box domain-containing protein n=1 Tax=Psilocybe cf. subviscida TaxID=2480587 RepID=A0A8H5F684_9AGAR|nr:hypothetical protein D9619_010118 [Psilocybe cf. subviscida]